ncbi:HAD-like domain-containing protein [Suillus paluster]|uniref:HAD-like domain-containing protein n=1 Tax=Suillus paluster TaxID=48578 RepID=UPI001B884F68|nr:HAD-like domain-containing protein [Suillus paluster]KAG1740553.1 HAD-like domain-containing protein [Suillus paluster]
MSPITYNIGSTNQSVYLSAYLSPPPILRLLFTYPLSLNLKNVYVIGMAGIEEEGISFIGGTDLADCTLDPFSSSNFTLDPDVQAVLCGSDLSVKYTKLSKTFQHLTRNPGCQFSVTNEDSTFPSADDRLPGAGEGSDKYRKTRKDDVGLYSSQLVVLFINALFDRVKFDPKRTIMVGDRLNTDILFGQAGGLATLLVLTGITSKQDITGPHASPIVPDYVTQSIGELRILDGK